MPVTKFDELLNAVCEVRRQEETIDFVTLTPDTTAVITDEGASHISKETRSIVGRLDIQTGAHEDSVITESGTKIKF